MNRHNPKSSHPWVPSRVRPPKPRARVDAMSLDAFENVTVQTKANVYFDGRCVSHSFTLANGEKKSAGVVLGPCELTFGTAAAEIMSCVGGGCEYRLKNTDLWVRCGEGGEFAIEGDSSFDIRVEGQFHYVCSYA